MLKSSLWQTWMPRSLLWGGEVGANNGDKKMTKKNKPTHAWGIAGLILGIIGLLLLFLAPNIGILFSITAVVFSVIQKIYEPTGIATAGLVIGIIGIILYVIVGFAFFEGHYSESGTTSVNVTNT